jgi:hypothetical protein
MKTVEILKSRLLLFSMVSVLLVCMLFVSTTSVYASQPADKTLVATVTTSASFTKSWNATMTNASSWTQKLYYGLDVIGVSKTDFATSYAKFGKQHRAELVSNGTSKIGPWTSIWTSGGACNPAGVVAPHKGAPVKYTSRVFVS